MTIKKLFIGVTLGLIILFGGGAAYAAPHSVSLAWTASPSMPTTIPSGSGYNIYRSSGACPAVGSLVSPVKINSSPITGLAATDSTPLGGQVYCYLATAILNGIEDQVSVMSGNTNFVAVTIPLAPATKVTIIGQQ